MGHQGPARRPADVLVRNPCELSQCLEGLHGALRAARLAADSPGPAPAGPRAGRVAPTATVLAAGQGAALGPEQGCVARCGGNKRAALVGDQRREAAPTVIAPAAGHDAAIAPEQYCVARSGGNLREAQVGDQRAEVAPIVVVLSACHGSAIAPEQDDMAR